MTNLDFSGIDKISNKKEKKNTDTMATQSHSNKLKTNNTINSKNGLNGQLEGLEDKTLFHRQIERQNKHISMAREVYSTYQENIKLSELKRSKILKGVAGGEDIYSLFLEAIKIISLMTDDESYYDQIKKDLMTIGRATDNKPVIEIEIKEAKQQLEQLEKAMTTTNTEEDKRRLQRAIKRHRDRIESLNTTLA